MAEKPKLVLVEGCGMNLRTRRARPTLNRVNVRAKKVPTHAGPLLDLQHSLGGDLLCPLRDGLRSDLHQGSQGSLGADLSGKNLKGVGVHGGQPYTISLQLSTGNSLPSPSPPYDHPPMVDKPKEKRAGPADSPKGYPTFAKWVEASTSRYGMGAELARYCGVERQNVQRWIEGALPEGQAMRRMIAEWAQVDYGEVSDALERDHEAKLAAKAAAKAEAKAEAGKAPPLHIRKKKPALRVAK